MRGPRPPSIGEARLLINAGAEPWTAREGCSSPPARAASSPRGEMESPAAALGARAVGAVGPARRSARDHRPRGGAQGRSLDSLEFLAMTRSPSRTIRTGRPGCVSPPGRASAQREGGSAQRARGVAGPRNEVERRPPPAPDLRSDLAMRRLFAASLSPPVLSSRPTLRSSPRSRSSTPRAASAGQARWQRLDPAPGSRGSRTSSSFRPLRSRVPPAAPGCCSSATARRP